jgi:hypothetical protein
VTAVKVNALSVDVTPCLPDTFNAELSGLTPAEFCSHSARVLSSSAFACAANTGASG